jgi:hypothetical protein
MYMKIIDSLGWRVLNLQFGLTRAGQGDFELLSHGQIQHDFFASAGN